MGFIILLILLEIPACIGMGLIFKKMNLDFVKGVIPFYNKIVLIKFFKLPNYHLILIFIPILFLYSSFEINRKICSKYNKEFIYVLELTFFPFIFNILFSFELKLNNIESSVDSDVSTKVIDSPDDYVWHPKSGVKSDTVYKASRNKIGAKVNIVSNKSDEIIDTDSEFKRVKENMQNCPKCGTPLPNNTDVCFVCGTKL